MGTPRRGHILEVSEIDKAYDSCILASSRRENGSIICNVLKRHTEYVWLVSVPTAAYQKLEAEWPVTVERTKIELGIYKH
ncbi:MAG: hypothetical protein AABX14_00280 [Candidatus Aenigmatarchaeota archaeon]